MNEPRKDDPLDEDLKALSSAYRAAPAANAEPPAALDDAIRAAARRAVSAGPRPVSRTWLSRSSTPLAAAAVLVLTVSIGFLSLDDPKVQVKSKLDDLGASQPISQAEPKIAPQMAPKSEAPVVSPEPAGEESKAAAAQERADFARRSAVPPAPAKPQPQLRVAEPAPAEGAVAQPPAAPAYVPAPPAPAVPSASVVPQQPRVAAAASNSVAAPPPPPAPSAAPMTEAPPPSVAKSADVVSSARPASKPGIRGLSEEDSRSRTEEKLSTAARASPRLDFEAIVIQSTPAQPSAPAEPKREASAAAPASIPQSIAEVQGEKRKAAASAKQFAPDPPRPAEAANSTVTVTGSRATVSGQDARAKRDAAAGALSKETERAESGADTGFRSSPESWVTRILELRKLGKTREADEELRKFRQRYPDYALPTELREALPPK